MAERLVLAQLVIDENGVVTGLANINAGLKETQNQSDRTGKKVEGLSGFFGKLEHRMFSLQHIAAAVLGGFTVAAAIHGIKSLIETVASADTGFALLKATVKGFYESVVGDGTKHVTIFHDAIVRLTQVVTILQIAFEELSNPQGPVGKALQMMLKFSVGGLVVTGLAKIAEATETIFGELSKPGGPLERFAKRFDEIQGKAKAVAETVKAVRVAEGEGFERGPRGSELNPFQAQRVDEATGRQTGLFGGTIRIAGQAALGAPQIKSAMDDAVGSIRNANTAWVEHNAQLRNVTISSIALGAAYSTMASSFNAWVEGGSISGRKFLHDLLSQIAQQAAVKSLFELAEGFAALAATWGTPNPSSAGHFQAAAIFGAVAAVAGAGARRTATGGAGGGGGGGERGRGFGQDIAPQQRQERSELTIIIQGNVIGQEQYVRKLVVDIQNGLRAGAGGGKL